MSIELAFVLNGRPVHTTVEPHHRLLDVLREALGETGTKEGCGEGECGACTVLVAERAVNACLFPAPEVEGLRVTTIEGLAGPGLELSAVQSAYLERGGAQCGFCSPGMVMATVALLAENPSPSEAEIRAALTGNLCRCTGYVQIIESIQAAAERMKTGATS